MSGEYGKGFFDTAIRCLRAETRVERLEEGLRWYADHSNWGIVRRWDGVHIEFLTIHEKPWERAEKALSGEL